MLKDQLKNELKQSMLAKNAVKTSVLRMLLSAIGYYEIQKGGAGYAASEEDVQTVTQKEMKQRRDSIEQFEKGGRMDLAEKEKAELAILTGYLPSQMGQEEIERLVKEAVTQTGASTLSDIGKVMSALMPKIKGKADGKIVSDLVKQELSQNIPPA
jgi:uncharacterized protein YqeY